VTKSFTLGFCAFASIALAGCSPDYSPNTYNGSAVQQANKVDTGIVIGYREVRISDDGSVGTVTGGAAGGILGAELSSPTVPTALAALGGTVVGGVVGATIQHVSGDTKGWEYIVREPKGDLVSVTQREPKPIAIGQKVLVIEGKQARIIPDYATASLDDPKPVPKADQKQDEEKEKAAVAAPPPPAEPVAPASTPAEATTVTSTTAVAAPAAAPAPAPASVTNSAASASPAPSSADAAKAPSDQPAPENSPAAATPPAPQAAPASSPDAPASSPPAAAAPPSP
jgi:outer membrane lipoprotein SlyB